MRKISADLIYTLEGKPIKNGVLVFDDEGKILDVLQDATLDESIEHFTGVLVPGMVNAHCHLELSFMKGQIPRHSGLIEFVKQVVTIRDDFSKETQQQSISDADKEMQKEGIVYVGDISNDTRSFFQKQKSNLGYHTFVELFDLGPGGTQQSVETGKETYQSIPQNELSGGSMTIHAPYTCTDDLIRFADSFSAENGRILSIHLQEHRDEDTMFIHKSGAWMNLFTEWGIDMDWFEKTGKSALQSTINYLDKNNKWLFVHNTHTSRNDIEFAQQQPNEVYWCLCPNSNLYIENQMPEFQKFMDSRAQCVIGTDSLASNDRLSILEEMKTIQKKVPQIPFEEILEWATLNGAKLFDKQSILGSFKPGKRPGVNLVENFDIENGRLTSDSKIKKIA
jgi:aminodeoxyfutalosine deaminase